jgi:hypothetical protein
MIRLDQPNPSRAVRTAENGSICAWNKGLQDGGLGIVGRRKASCLVRKNKPFPVLLPEAQNWPLRKGFFE